MTLDDLLDNPTANALITCASQGNTSLVEIALNQGIDINASVGGRTALTEAANFHHLETVAFLLRHDVDINKPGTGGNTALNISLINNDAVLARKLILAGADTNIPNSLGHTPLMQAVQAGNDDLVILLLEHGADTEATDKNGKTALDMLPADGHAAAADALMRIHRALTHDQEEHARAMARQEKLRTLARKNRFKL